MIVYLDSTVVLRQLLGTGKRWVGWGKWDKAYASVLLRTECCRAANRLRAEGKLNDEQRAKLGKWIESVCSCVTTVPLTDEILGRAAEPFPVNVGTLQGLHLATMLELKAARGIACALATDDRGLLLAAESLGFENALAASPKEAAEAAS
ncbi:MAG: hypothetical protein IJ658_12815 [Kiritimatiellae bacterium]|nr:hypothetical protein [Kiritimatiellia bacterium]